MQNLITFIIRHHYVFLFLLLQLLSATLVVSYNRFQKSSFLVGANEVSGQLYDAVNDVTGYLSLRKTNEELASDNARLRGALRNSLLRLEGSEVSVNDTIHRQQYVYLGAAVLNSTTNKRNNFVILNVGRKHGVAPEMGVLNSTGVVGIVKDVSENFCSVLSLLHKDSKVSVSLANSRYFGLLTWEDEDNSLEATLSDIPSHVKLAPGDTIVSRGASGIFPAGIPVATIKTFEVIPGSDFYAIKVSLLANFHSLSYCYVVKNLMREEQLKLEEGFGDD